MEDTVITTTAPESDVVMTANTSPENTAGYVQVQEPVVDPSQSSAVTPQPTVAPKTDRELAYEEINRRQVENYNTKGSSITNWINNDYNYNPNDAGTLWVAGKINDVNTQMKFLEATLNEDLYSEMDLKKYFFDTNLATARAYAKEKKHETAYGFYRAAQEKAIAEGQLTGWYMPPEAGYMLSQWILADESLKDSTISDIDRARAESVRRAVSGWFAANNITERGIECLNSLYLKETIRHNKENERLQEDANKIQELQNKINNQNNAQSYEDSKRLYKFQLAEYELGVGYDLDKDGVVGHTGEFADRFEHYSSMKEWAQHNLGNAEASWGSDRTRTILGDDYAKAKLEYDRNVKLKAIKTKIETERYIPQDIFESTKKYTKDGDEIKYMVIGDKVSVGYFEDGSWIPITDENASFSSGESIKEFIESTYGEGSMSTQEIYSVNIDGKIYDFGKRNTSRDPMSATMLIDNGYTPMLLDNYEYFDYDEKGSQVYDLIIKSQSHKGTVDKNGDRVRNLEYKGGYVDTKGTNKYFLLEGTDSSGEKVLYVPEYNENKGEYVLKRLKKSNLVEIGKVKDNFKIGDTWGSVVTKDNPLIPDLDTEKELISKSAWKIGYDEKSGKTYLAVINADGTAEYVAVKRSTKFDTDAKSELSVWSGVINAPNYVVSDILTEDEITKAGFKPIAKKEANYYRESLDTSINVEDSPTIEFADVEIPSDEDLPEPVKNDYENIDVSPTKFSGGNSGPAKATPLSYSPEKSSEQQVLEDWEKYVTAYEEGEVKKSIEDINEEILKTLGIRI